MTQEASTSCPHCGAPLRSKQIACAYCGTRAAKPGFAPPPGQDPNAPIESARLPSGYLAIAVATGLVVIGACAAAFLSAREPGPTPDLSAPLVPVAPLAPPSSVVAADPPPPLRARPGVLVLDVDNDGTDDIVARFDRAGRSWIGAVSGVSGREIWRALETTPHARSADIGEVRAVVAQTLVATTPSGDVRGFDAKTGRLLWTEPAVSGWDGGICVGGDYVGFAAGRAITKLGLATGARAIGARRLRAPAATRRTARGQTSRSSMRPRSRRYPRPRSRASRWCARWCPTWERCACCWATKTRGAPSPSPRNRNCSGACPFRLRALTTGSCRGRHAPRFGRTASSFRITRKEERVSGSPLST